MSLDNDKCHRMDCLVNEWLLDLDEDSECPVTVADSDYNYRMCQILKEIITKALKEQGHT